MEFPNVDAVVFCRRDDHTVVQGVEHCAHNWVCMTNKCLKEVRHCLLGIVVPHFKQVVLTSGEHVAAIIG